MTHTHEVQIGPHGSHPVISSEPFFAGPPPKYQAVYDMLRALEEAKGAIDERNEMASRLHIAECKLKRWEEAEEKLPEIEGMLRKVPLHTSGTLNIDGALSAIPRLLRWLEERRATIERLRDERDEMERKTWEQRSKIRDLERMIAEREDGE